MPDTCISIYILITHMHGQYFAGGAGAEADIAKSLEKITSIVRLGYNFSSPSFRTRIDRYIMRNTDLGECSLRTHIVLWGCGLLCTVFCLQFVRNGQVSQPRLVYSPVYHVPHNKLCTVVKILFLSDKLLYAHAHVILPSRRALLCACVLER